MSRWLLTLLTLSAVAAAVVLAIARPGAFSRDGTFARSAAAVPATSTPWAYIDKINNGDGWCDPNHIDATTTEYVGDSHQFALCVGNLTLGHPVRSFQATIGYDGDLDECIDKVCQPPVLGVQTVQIDAGCVDDNPDANAGVTQWGDGLGDNWDCFFAFDAGPNLGFIETGQDPTCDLPDHGSSQLSAGISCHGKSSFTLGDDETWGALAVLNMNVIASGVDNVDIQALHVYTESVDPIIDCSLVYSADVNADTVIEGLCQGATDIKRQPVRHRSPTPTLKPPATPTTEVPTVPPPPPATPTPSGGAGPVIVAPITGSGPTGSDAPWALWLAAGVAGAALAAGGFYIRYARCDR
jgi:hypothetical protein